MDYSIMDIETDALVSTKIHCMSIHQVRGTRSRDFTLLNYSDMIAFVLNEPIIIGHNIVRFDIPELEKVLGIKIKARLLDTLAFSWYLYPQLKKHGLDEWGEYLGVKKPPIDNWVDLPVEVYVNRCQEDVKINTKLFDMQIAGFKAIYGNDDINPIMNYLTWKLDCAKEQEKIKWKLDVDKCTAGISTLELEESHRFEELKKAIPDNILHRTVKKPKVTHKKDGTPSEHGKKWFEILEDIGLPSNYSQPIKIVCGTEQGNPGSFPQLKRWLDSLGWIPDTFKYSKDKVTGAIRKVPQISNTDGSGLCDSVKRLFEKEPQLEHLEGLFVVRHRLGLLRGFLRDKDEHNFIKAEISGFTNTLRFQHKTIVNLPTVHKKYGELIRGCLMAPDDDTVLCGSDMSSLEDSTKQHFMYFFDPEYVTKMRVPGFDPHLAMAVFAGMLTEEESEYYKWYEKNITENEIKLFDKRDNEIYVFSEEEKVRYKRIKKIRGEAKVVNFSAIYGVGAAKMALGTKWTIAKCKQLLRAYWELNKAVKKVADACTVKRIGNQMWLYNPVSKFWYSLRIEKDRFSTLNQGTGAYCFDVNIKHVRKRGIKICGQFHDEHIDPVKKGNEEKHKALLFEAIADTNEELKLNVPLGISVAFGHNYADIH